ncbi:hypothetical protein TNCV_3727221 [Trichonephila clavipes]|uniref:Uncharacterized protein n=1 Tax=Trichonephila clavipes TaxID=2585209 RepID=A0A8X6R141_TRICX|nr:hypothetical protein TNCV_3727221 [Trichonephila clavipes]
MYTPEPATNNGSNDDKKQITLPGDLNVHFASEEAKPFIEFLKRTLNLTMNTDYREGTRYRTTIGAVFSHFLMDLIFISYFSNHTPVSFLENDDAKS